MADRVKHNQSQPRGEEGKAAGTGQRDDRGLARGGVFGGMNWGSAPFWGNSRRTCNSYRRRCSQKRPHAP
jgi:hypothetical protein